MTHQNKAPDIEQASEILKEYVEPYSMIDDGNLFFAACEYRKALTAALAERDALKALLKEFFVCYDAFLSEIKNGAGRE